MKMLIVDDEYGARVLLNEILRGQGDTDIAVNGKEALEAFSLAWKENEPYQIIWLDIMMPEIDGHSVLSEIRRYEKEIGLSEMDGVAVVMTSALDDPVNVMKAYSKGGALDYLIKPFTKEQVLKIIDKVRDNG